MNYQQNNILEGLQESIQAIDSRLEKIEGALIGDPDLGNEGLTKRLRTLEQDQIQLKGQIDRILWAASVIGVLGGILIQVVMAFIR